MQLLIPLVLLLLLDFVGALLGEQCYPCPDDADLDPKDPSRLLDMVNFTCDDLSKRQYLYRYFLESCMFTSRKQEVHLAYSADPPGFNREAYCARLNYTMTQMDTNKSFENLYKLCFTKQNGLNKGCSAYKRSVVAEMTTHQNNILPNTSKLQHITLSVQLCNEDSCSKHYGPRYKNGKYIFNCSRAHKVFNDSLWSIIFVTVLTQANYVVWNQISFLKE